MKSQLGRLRTELGSLRVGKVRNNQTANVGSLVTLFRICRRIGTPCYAYSKQSLILNVEKIDEALRTLNSRAYFALMSNHNVHILRILRSHGLGAHCCSLAEVEMAQSAGYGNEEIIITGSNLSNSELEYFKSLNLVVNVDSVEQLKRMVRINWNQPIGIRINTTRAVQGCTTPTEYSRLGIEKEQLPTVLKDCSRAGIEVAGLQQYSGTNLFDVSAILRGIDVLFEIAPNIQKLRFIDVGGGFGHNYETGQSFDWNEFVRKLSERLRDLGSSVGQKPTIYLEPGRSIIASCGFLLCKVVEVKRINGDTYVGTDASLSVFARPYIYKQRHRIIPLRKRPGRFGRTHICGNTIASGDVLGTFENFHEVREDDILAILDTGAYGHCMASNFCGRLRPPEVLVQDGEYKLIRERETEKDILALMGVSRPARKPI